jgi:hypothetical protein
VRVLCVLTLIGCGTDTAGGGDGGLIGDGPPPPGLSVRVTAPNGGESFYQTETVSVSWVPHNDTPGSIRCDAEVYGATTEAIAVEASTASDQSTLATWMPSAVGTYRITVTCRDDLGRMASDESDADFTITPPPRDVSFAGELQPLLTAGCTAANCHDTTQPQTGLNLTANVAYDELVGVTSFQCANLQLVKPGSPNDSYLIDKFIGGNPGGCYIGVRMPKLASAFSASQIQAFRDWIANGAPDN